MNRMDRISNYKIISYISLLLLICVCSFLIAKYIVRDSIKGEEIPIDTSTRI